MWNLLAFATALCVFHVSEFMLAFVFMRKELSWQSWLLSRSYCVAMSVALLEYFLETWLFPGLKAQRAVSLLGLAMVLAGEAIRKAGMLTAKGSFTHIIKREKRPDHELVTWGIYRFVRHPGYLGWFIWAVGTQVLLVNPLAAVLFAFVAWHFFDARIQTEEFYLRQFFPEYTEYATRTPTWIPFIQ